MSDDEKEKWEHAGMERAQIRSRLAELEDVVESQQQQINELESRLKLVEGSNAGLAGRGAVGCPLGARSVRLRPAGIWVHQPSPVRPRRRRRRRHRQTD